MSDKIQEGEERVQNSIQGLSKQEKMNRDSFGRKNYLDYYSSEKLLDSEKLVMDKYLATGRELKILDVGCGVGRTTINFYRQGHDVEGIDIVPAMIDMAKKKYPIVNFKIMNVCSLEYPDNYFDIVFFSFNGLDCIYPYKKRIQAILEMKRVLRRGGLLIFSSHNFAMWPKNKYEWFWWFLNIITFRIFTYYKLEYKGIRVGIKLILFGQCPSKQIKNIERLGGLQWLDIFADTNLNFLRKKILASKKMFLINIFSVYSYFVFKKQ